ncbi:galactitol-1-phosphate 5-dehydrogenase [bacterium]
MKALVLEGNSNLKVSNVPNPKIKDDECLIKVKCAGICNSDIYRAFNNEAYFYPLIMGHEFSGVIKKVGNRVKDFKEGDRVVVFPLIPCNECDFCKQKKYAQCLKYDYYGSRRNGAFAEYIAVKEWNLLKIPNSIGFEEASLIEPIAVALHAVKKVKVSDNPNIAIIGAGLIGLIIAISLLEKNRNANIYVIDRNSDKLSFIKFTNVNTILAKDNWVDEILNLTQGVDTVFEVCGAVDTFKNSLKILKSHGQAIWVGNIVGDLLLGKALVSDILRREIAIKGVWNSKYLHDNNDDWHDAIKFLKRNKSIIQKLITHKVRLNEGADLIKKLYLKKSKNNKKNTDTYIKGIFVV